MLLFDYTKNVTKSIVYSAIDVASKQAPSIKSFNENNNDLFKNVYHSVKDYKGTFNKISGTIKGSKIYEAADVGFNAVLDDLATGKFYNKQRIEEIESGRGNIFGGFDDDVSFGDGSSSGSSSFDDAENITKSMTTGDKLVAEAVINSSKFSADTVARSVAESSRLVAETQKSSTNLMYIQSQRMMDTMKIGLNGLSNELQNINSFNAQVMQNHANNSKTFFEISTKLLQDQNTMLKELLDMKKQEFKALNPEKKEKKKKISFDDIIDSNGMPNLKEYFGNVKENTNNTLGKYLPMDMLFGGDGNMLLNFVSSPLSFIPMLLMNSMLSPAMTKAFKDIDTSISGMFSTAMAKLGKMSKDDDSNFFTRIFGEIFGVRDSVKSSLDTGKFEKGPVPFDGLVRKSIIDVIPGHLARIESILSGKPERIFDLQSGKWKDSGTLKDEFNNIRKSNVNSAFTELKDEINKHKKRITFGSRRDSEKFDTDIEKILDKIYSDGGDFSPNSSKTDDYLDYGVNELSMTLFKRLFNRANKRVTMSMAKNVKSQRARENKLLEDMEEKGSIYNKLFDGSDLNSNLIKDKYKSTEKTTVYEDSALNIKNKLTSQLDNLGHNIFYYLQNMYKELTYMRKFGSGIGGSLSLASSGASNVQIENSFGRRLAQGSIADINKIDIVNNAKKTESQIRRETDYKKDEDYTTKEAKRIEELKKKGIKPALIDYYASGDELKDMVSSASVQFRRAGEDSVRRNLKEEEENSTWLYNLINDSAKNIRDNNYEKLKDSKSNDENGIISKLLKAETLGEKFAIIQNGLDTLVRSPGTMITTVIGKADQSIYDFFYGNETDVKDEKGNKIKGFFNRMVYELKGTFGKVNTWIDNTILKPIKDKLGADTMGQAFKNLLGTVGIDVDAIKDNVKNFFVGDNGILTPIKNSISEAFKNAYEESKKSIKKSYTDAKSLMGIDDEDDDETINIKKIEKPSRRKYSELSDHEKHARKLDIVSKYYSGDSKLFNDFLKDKQLDIMHDKSYSDDYINKRYSKYEKDIAYMNSLSSRETKLKKAIDAYSKQTQSDVHKAKYTKFKNQLDDIKTSLGIPLDMNITRLVSKKDPTKEEANIIKVLSEDSNTLKRIIALEEMTTKYTGPEEKVKSLTGLLDKVVKGKEKLFTKYNLTPDKLKETALDEDGNIKDRILKNITESLHKNLNSVNFWNNDTKIDALEDDKHVLLDLEEIAKKPESIKDMNIVTYMNTLDEISKEFHTNDPISRLEQLIRLEKYKLKKAIGEKTKTDIEGKINLYNDKLNKYNNAKTYRDDTIRSSIIDSLGVAGISSDREDAKNFINTILKDDIRANDIGNRLTPESLRDYALGGKFTGIERDLKTHLNNVVPNSLTNQGHDDIAITLSGVEEATEQSRIELKSSNSLLSEISNKIDAVIKAIVNTSVGTHATGARYITKSGLTAISEGEAIIPAEQNPFNPNRDKVNKKQEQKNEKQIKSDFAKELAESIYSGVRENSDGSQTIDGKQGALAKGFSNFRAGTSEFTSRLFGDHDKMNSVVQDIGEKVRTHLPKGIAGGLLGGAIGLATGFAGPLVAAIGGSALSIASTSEKFQSVLFGDKIFDKDGNDKGRDGGIVSKDLQDTMKKYLPDLKAYGITGTLLGLVTPFGPLGGLMIGSSLAYVKNNDKYREMFFGDEEGLLNKDRRKAISDAFPNVAAGVVSSILLGPFGILGNAALGTGIGLLSTTDEFKNLLLGEMGDDGKRKGGIAEAIRLKVVDPLSDFASKMQSTLMNFIKKDMVEPLKNAISPIGKDIKIAVGATFNTVGKFINKIFETSLGKPLDMLIKEKLISPITKMSSFLFKAVTKPAKAVVSAPFKLIGKYGDMRRGSHIKSGNADYMTANERLNFRDSHNMGTDGMTSFDEMIANASRDDVNEIYRQMGVVKGGTEFLKRHEDTASSNLGSTVYREDKLSSGDRTKILKHLHSGDVKSAHEIIYANKNLKLLEKEKLAKKAAEQAEELRRIKFQKQNYTGNKSDIYETLKTKYGIKDIGDHNIKKYMKMLEHEGSARISSDAEYSNGDDQYKSITDTLDNNSAEVISYLKNAVNILNDIKEGNTEPSDYQKKQLESMQQQDSIYRKNLSAPDRKLMQDRSNSISKAYDGLKLTEENEYSLIDNKDRYSKITELADKDYKFRDLNTLLKYNETQLDRIITLANFGYDINDYDKFAKMSDQGFSNVLRLSKMGYKFTDINKIANLDDSKVEYLEKMYKAGYNNENMSLENQLKGQKNQRQLLDDPEKFQEAGLKFKSSDKEDDSIKFIGKDKPNTKKQTRIEMTPDGPLTYVKNLDGSETLAKTKDNQKVIEEQDSRDQTQKGIYTSITSLSTNLMGWVKGAFGGGKKKEEKPLWERLSEMIGTGALIYGALNILPEINKAINDGKSAIVGAIKGVGKTISNIWGWLKKIGGVTGDGEESAEQRITGGVARMYLHGTKPSNFIPGIGKLKYAKWGVEKAEQAGEFAVKNGYRFGKYVLQNTAPVEALEHLKSATGIQLKAAKLGTDIIPEVAKAGYRAGKAFVSPLGDMVKYGAKGVYQLNALVPGMKTVMDTGAGYAKAGNLIGGYIADGLKDKAGNIVSNIAEKGTGMMNKVSSSLIPGMKTVMDTGAGYAKAGNLIGGYIAGGLKDKVSNLIGGNSFQNMAGNMYGDLPDVKNATRMAEKAAGSLVSEGAESAVDAASKGKIATYMAKIKGALEGLLPKIKPFLSSKEAGKAVGSLFDKILIECEKRLPKSITKIAAGASTAGILTAVDVFAGFISGYQDCNSIFGITHGATDGMKLASALIRALNNGCLFGIIPEKWIMTAVIDYIGPAVGFDMSTIQQLRKESEAEVAAYNSKAENAGKNYDVEQYNKKVLGDTTIFEKFQDSEIVKFVKDKAVQGASVVWDGIKTAGSWAYDNLSNLIGGMVDLGSYVGNVVKSQVQFAFNADNSQTEQDISASDSKDGILSPIKKVLYYGIRSSVMIPSLVVKAGALMVDALKPFVDPMMNMGSAIGTIIAKDWESAKAGDTGNMWNWNYADGTENSFSTISNLVGIGSKIVFTPISMFNAMTESVQKNVGSLFTAFSGIGTGLVNGVQSTLSAAFLGDYEGLFKTTTFGSGFEMVDGMASIADIIGKVLAAPIAYTFAPIGLVVRGYKELTNLVSMNATDAEKQKIESGAYGFMDVMNPSSEYWGDQGVDNSGNPLSMLGVIGNKIYKMMMAPIVMFRSIMDKVTESVDSVKGWFGDKLSKLKDMFGWGDKNPATPTPTPVVNPGGTTNIATPKESNELKQRRAKFYQANPKYSVMTNGQVSEEELTAAGFGKYGRGKQMIATDIDDSPVDSNGNAKFYSQLDPKYSMQYNASYDTTSQSLKDSGCGPVSASNVASVFGKTLDPRDAAKYALDNGYKEKDGGTTPGFFGNVLGKLGIGTNYENNQSAMNQLQQGNPVIMMGQDNKVTGKNPYGPYPHYVVGTGLDGKGNVIVQDPESTTPSLKYKASEVMSKTNLAISTNGYGLGKIGNKFGLGKYGMDDIKRYMNKVKYGMGGNQTEGVAAAIANGLLSTGVEGGADSVNPNDKGAPSIGMSQWHLDRAKYLLSTIPGGNAFIGMMDAPIGQDVANQIASVIGSDAGKKAQLELLKNDCMQNYIPAIAEIGGITNGKVMVYIGMWMPTSTSVVQTFIRNRMNRIDINNLEAVYQLFKNEYNAASGGNNYGSRADQTYEYCKSLPDNLSNVQLDPSLAGKNAGNQSSQNKPKNKGIFGLFDEISSGLNSKLSGVMDPLTNSFNALQEQTYGPMKKLLFGDDDSSSSSGSSTNNSGAQGALPINSNAPDAQNWLASNIPGAQITSPFGNRIHPITGNETFHKGVDIAADLGVRIPSPVSGVVTDVGFQGDQDKKTGYGFFTEVTDKDGKTHLFAHMDSLVHNKGDQIKKGDDVGPLGSSGGSTGPHVHYQIEQGGQPIDPSGVNNTGLGKKGLTRPKLNMGKSEDVKTGAGGVDGLDYSSLLNTIVQLLTVIAQNTGALSKLDESLSKSTGTSPEINPDNLKNSVKSKLGQLLTSSKNGSGDSFLNKDILSIMNTMQTLAE